MLDELTFKNFRGFSSLELKGLKRVNVIVGQNNTGKTSLLEGVMLLSEPMRIDRLPGLFRALQGNANVRYYPWLVKDGTKYEETLLGRRTETGMASILLRLNTNQSSPLPPQFFGPIAQTGVISVYQGQNFTPSTCRIISVQYSDPSIIVKLLGKAYRKTGGEEALQKLLTVIDPRIKKIRIDPGDDGNQIIIDIGLTELLPLAQVGQGVYRIISILADIIAEEARIFLIDEIENGLHHSVLEHVWSGLAETAEKLNIQIFATTHSGECLQAANKAFQKRPHYDLAVIQLFRNDNGVQGRVLDKTHIETAVSEDIELR